jgi:hypothetical protein
VPPTTSTRGTTVLLISSFQAFRTPQSRRFPSEETYRMAPYATVMTTLPRLCP